ncbi:hypothetical protein BT69DRAFT_1335336 [Atractiella rhizophila]|nr:hypothetical protein BT69DRAFT_1335336 [Atractiella rhizophila]
MSVPPTSLPPGWEEEANHVPVISLGSSRSDVEKVLHEYTSQSQEYGLTTLPHLLSNRYYTTLLNFEIFGSFDAILKAGKASSQALILSVAFRSEELPALKELLSVLSDSSNNYEVALVLVLFSSASASAAQDKLKEEFEDTCADAGFEMVEVPLGVEGKQTTSDEEREDGFGEISGMKRVEEALSACRWEKMVLKSQGKERKGKGRLEEREVHSSEDEGPHRERDDSLPSISADDGGFNDDFSNFVSAATPTLSRSSQSKSSTATWDEEGFGAFTPTLQASTSSAHLPFPSAKEIEEAHDAIFGKSLSGNQDHDPFFDTDEEDDVPFDRAAYGQLDDGLASDEDLSKEFRKLDEQGDFDLGRVIENLRNLKEIASEIENEEERKAFAEKVALGFQSHFEKE